MEKIILKRQSGKTSKILQKANNYNGYIVCCNNIEARRVFNEAKKLKLDINFPLTFREFSKKEYYGKGIKKFHIDNADMLLQFLSNVPIDTITMDSN